MRNKNDQDTFRINEPHVISEEIEGEAIILNFDSGTYYSLNKTAMKIWRLIQAGSPCSLILSQLTKSYAADGKQIAADFDLFLQQLQEEQLIVPTAPALTSGPSPNNGRGALSAPASAVTEGTPYERPILNKFTDLQNLLLLDPIHDVDEMGWPHPAP